MKKLWFVKVLNWSNNKPLNSYSIVNASLTYDQNLTSVELITLYSCKLYIISVNCKSYASIKDYKTNYCKRECSSR